MLSLSRLDSMGISPNNNFNLGGSSIVFCIFHLAFGVIDENECFRFVIGKIDGFVGCGCFGYVMGQNIF